MAKERMIKDGYREGDVTWKKTLIFLRFAGQDSPLEIDYRAGDDILFSFRQNTFQSSVIGSNAM